jgi:hypothetical protein
MVAGVVIQGPGLHIYYEEGLSPSIGFLAFIPGSFRLDPGVGLTWLYLLALLELDGFLDLGRWIEESAVARSLDELLADELHDRSKVLRSLQT